MDLSNNDMDLPGASLATVTDQIRQGAGAGIGSPGAPVMADQHTPKRSIDRQGNRDGGPHRHVAKILQVDRRYGAQGRKRQIGRRRTASRTGQRHRGGKRVFDRPDALTQIQPACLSRHVGRRIMQPEERFQVRRAIFGDDLPMSDRIEAIDHGPVEPRGAPQLRRGDRHQ